MVRNFLPWVFVRNQLPEKENSEVEQYSGYWGDSSEVEQYSQSEDQNETDDSDDQSESQGASTDAGDICAENIGDIKVKEKETVEDIEDDMSVDELETDDNDEVPTSSSEKHLAQSEVILEALSSDDDDKLEGLHTQSPDKQEVSEIIISMNCRV